MENRCLFKAKTARIVDSFNNAEDGIWVKGYLKCDTGKWEISQFEYDRADYVWYEVDPSTICQCTGLRDKNGKLIWENDIVNCLTEECCGYIGWNESEAGFYFNVLLEDGRFEEEHDSKGTGRYESRNVPYDDYGCGQTEWIRRFFQGCFEIYRVGDLEFWDLLFKRYASPFLLMDEMIATERLVEFVDSIVKRTNKDTEEDVLWEFFLNKVQGESYEDFVNRVRDQASSQKSLSDEEIKAMVENSMNAFGIELV